MISREWLLTKILLKALIVDFTASSAVGNNKSTDMINELHPTYLHIVTFSVQSEFIKSRL